MDPFLERLVVVRYGVAHLFHFRDLLEEIGLVSTVLAVKHGVPLNTFDLLGMLERYNNKTGMFFTLAGEIKMSPREMQKVTKLPVGKFPYDKHVSPSTELQLLRQRNYLLYN